MTEKIIELDALDGVKLNGFLITGKSKNKSILIEIHGMTSNCFKKREKIIAETVKKANIDTLCFNTRGSEIVKYIKYADGRKELAGTAYEDIEESYYDILGAIKYVISLGYYSIYLQGHSLGATKIVYTYKRMRKNKDEEIRYIKGILLLSLVDLPDIFNLPTNNKYLLFAEEKEKEGDILTLMPKGAFFHPISVKTYLKYTKYNNMINFAQYSKEDFNFDTLNEIDKPLFMRWGTYNELIRKSADEQVKLMRKVIKNPKSNIDFINGADHTYSDKEAELAQEITNFLIEIDKT